MLEEGEVVGEVHEDEALLGAEVASVIEEGEVDSATEEEEADLAIEEAEAECVEAVEEALVQEDGVAEHRADEATSGRDIGSSEADFFWRYKALLTC